MNNQTFTTTIAGRTVSAHISDLALQANGSVMLSCDGTVILATATQGNDAHKNPGYFNLTVEYSERFYAAGKIIGVQFQRREGRPSTQATLASRIIDRTCRPLFDQNDKNSVQLIATVLSLGDFDPVVLATNAVSLALNISDIPWNGPIGCARVGIPPNQTTPSLRATPPQEGNSEIIQNPYFHNDFDGTNLSADLLVCGDGTTVNMIEMSGNETPESQFDTLIDTAVELTHQWVSFIKDTAKQVSKTKKNIEKNEASPLLHELYAIHIAPIIDTELFGIDSKSRIKNLHRIWQEAIDVHKKGNPDMDTSLLHTWEDFLDHQIDAVLHKAAIEQGKRADGRALDEVRPLYAQAGGISDRLHGSGTFYRGETHVVSIATLAGPDSNLRLESMEFTGEQRFMHHYNFPPYSVGETGRIGFTGRREIGHGALAEKALQAVIPDIEDFPYTIRVVSECVSSNGSTSQASVCAATLALMDAGVPIKRPVVGISVGLMMSADKYALLTDIQGPEDHHGDMDFKVAGTSEGITAIQLDIKLDGIPVQICKEAVRASRKAHVTILNTITDAIPTHRPELSPYAPRIEILTIDPELIGLVIGGGGKTIQKIQKDTNTTISIEDDGKIFITGAGYVAPTDPDELVKLQKLGRIGESGAERARKIIEDMTHQWEVGERVTVTIVKIIDETGAIVEWGSASGMIHISEISKDRVARVSDKLSVGQVVDAVIIQVDRERDRIGLSMKKLSEKA
jgi:polyribonucleotide nucleotidyltransferase